MSRKHLLFWCLLWFSGSLFSTTPLFVKPTDEHFVLFFESIAKDEKLRRNDAPVQSFYTHKPADSKEQVLTYWPEARFLLRTGNTEVAEPAARNLLGATKFIDLENGVVATHDEIGSSTFLEAAPDVIADIRKCLGGQRVVVATPPATDIGPLDVVVLRVKPHALRYESNGTHCDYHIAELRVETGPLRNEVLSVAVPAEGTLLHDRLANRNRLWPQWWKSLTTPANRLTVTGADVKGFLRAKRAASPIAFISTLDLQDVRLREPHKPTQAGEDQRAKK